MADRLWSAWYDAILPDVPGCPAGAADYAIKRAAIDFCDRSCAWRKALPAIDSVASTAGENGEYTLPAAGTGQVVAKLIECRWIGSALTFKRPDELQDIYNPTDWRTVTGPTPQYFTQETPNKVRLVPAPSSSTVGAINGLWAAVRPADTATGIDDDVGSEYHQAIVDGAKARLFESPDKPYTNPQLAQTYQALFDSEIGNAAFRAFRGSGGRQRTQTSFT
jgi:hypothetical protein